MAGLVRVPPVLGPLLRGRTSECARLDALLSAVRRGESGALVLRGEAGMGKTALLDYTERLCEGCRVIRAGGIESEMELPFAAVQQLCMPLLDGLERLPAPQRDALRTAFGLTSGPRPDRFLVGLAVLGAIFYALGRWYPGSGAEQVAWRPTRSYEDEIRLELEDVDQMIEAQNERRRATGRPEISEAQIRDQVAADERRRAAAARRYRDEG